ncbi:two-component system, OmpR family, sensor kinase [Curtobacterium sp. 314Chir4.1]|nr:two-component system, OmpR family, sensor kinase [Curtobacterium sp. 314Chir4.1]
MRSVRARIVVAIGVILILAIAVSAVLSTVLLRSYLEGRVDDRLRETSTRLTASLDALHGLDLSASQLRDFTDKGTRDVVALADSRAIAWSGVDADTADRIADHEDLFSEPTPVPGHPKLVAMAVDVHDLGLVLNVGGVRTPCDTIVLVNDSSDDVATVSQVVRITFITSLASIAFLVLLAWLIVTRGLRPLRIMAEHAARIAGGDRRRRLSPDSDDPDITRLASTVNAALDAQADAEARVRSFVADASHELRTPLTTAVGWIELDLAGGLLEADARAHAIHRVHVQLARMRTLVEELALLTRLDEGTAADGQPLDLEPLLEETVDDARVVDPDRMITLDVRGPLSVTADEGRLLQVFRNLIGNAVRHTSSTATVRVTATRTSGFAEVRVADTGPGLRPDQMPHIFERFWRGDSSRTRETGGSGLGLAIVRSIVESYNGTVTAESELGVGTVLVVRLPLLASTPSGNRQP